MDLRKSFFLFEIYNFLSEKYINIGYNAKGNKLWEKKFLMSWMN